MFVVAPDLDVVFKLLLSDNCQFEFHAAERGLAIFAALNGLLEVFHESFLVLPAEQIGEVFVIICYLGCFSHLP